MLLSALLVVALAAEIFLFVGKDYLLDTRRRAALETSIRQAHADLQESKKRIEGRRTALIAAMDEADRQRAEMLEADKAFKRSQKKVPALIHTLGQPDTGVRFRARISKELPATPEASQQLIWNCDNYVEVWADDADAARQLLSKLFPFKQGYDAGDLVALEPQGSAAVREAAA